jgi:hypothetical protein
VLEGLAGGGRDHGQRAASVASDVVATHLLGRGTRARHQQSVKNKIKYKNVCVLVCWRGWPVEGGIMDRGLAPWLLPPCWVGAPERITTRACAIHWWTPTWPPTNTPQSTTRAHRRPHAPTTSTTTHMHTERDRDTPTHQMVPLNQPAYRDHIRPRLPGHKGVLIKFV